MRRRGRLGTAAASALAAALFLGAAQVPDADAAGSGTAPKAADKGPVGWDTYRRLDRMPELGGGARTAQFSSFDRTGGNEDGFDGRYACLRQSAAGCVIAERSGAGEVGAIWFTRDEGDVRKTGRITIELDGEKVVDAPLQDVVDGKLGAPFVHPLVANADQTSGGVYIEVPMPFRESMRITTEHNPLFHHVSYRTFDDAEGITTFDPADPAQDVVDTLKAAGTADPKPAQPGAKTTRSQLDLAPGASQTLAASDTPGLLSALKLTLPQAPYVEAGSETDEGRAFGKDGSSTFTVEVDPANQGVRLSRRYDPMIGRQTASVTVDGQPAGQWGPTGAQGAGLWAEESLDLPAALTAGKSRITVKNAFVSSDLDVNEFRYRAESAVGGGHQLSDTVDVGDPADESAHGYRITGQTWEGVRTYDHALDEAQRAKLAAARKLLTGLRLRISFDGERTVDSPLGEFFGSGHAVAPVHSLMSGIDAPRSAFSSWWAMPYAKNAEVQLYNGSGTAVTAGTAEVTAAPSKEHAAAVAAGTEGHFRTSSHAGPTTPGKDWSFLGAEGKGKFTGVSHTMTGALNRNFLEGDERSYADGSRTPEIHGTGSEDFYQSGWYFNRGAYSAPFNGNPAHLTPATGCPAERDCTGAYRLLIADAVPFTTGLDFGIEHGPTNDQQADYSSTAYWYGRAEKGAETTDTLVLGDEQSEQQHGYTSADPGAVTPLDSRFEGDRAGAPRLTADTRAAEAAVTFSLAVDSGNDGVRLRRLSDQKEAGQRVAVSVDGVRLADWSQPLGNGERRWLEDVYQLPASVTAGKDSVEVTLTPAEGAPAWSAARYEAMSLK